MTLRYEYVYLPHSYGGHRPANRVKIEEYEHGIIFGVPLFTTMHMTMMRMMKHSLTDARNDAAKAGAGRRTDVEKVVRTGKLRAVKVDENGIGHIESVSFADPRGPSATVTITDPEALAVLSGGFRGVSVESTFEDVPRELFEMLTGNPPPHRKGCCYSRTGRCICDYIAQWDNK